jgi:hypothetical protein
MSLTRRIKDREFGLDSAWPRLTTSLETDEQQAAQLDLPYPDGSELESETRTFINGDDHTSTDGWRGPSQIGIALKRPRDRESNRGELSKLAKESGCWGRIGETGLRRQHSRPV